MVVSTSDTAAPFIDGIEALAVRFTVRPIGPMRRRLPEQVTFLRFLGGHAYYNLPRDPGDSLEVHVTTFQGRLISGNYSRPLNAPAPP